MIMDLMKYQGIKMLASFHGGEWRLKIINCYTYMFLSNQQNIWKVRLGYILYAL